MTFWLAALAMALLVGLLAWRLVRQRAQESGETDKGGAETAAEPAAWGLDEEDWVALTPAHWRKGQLRALLRQGMRLARIAGTPDAILEHRDGPLVLGLETGRPYPGRPEWSDVAALTLQMGLAAERWPQREISGVLRYEDQAVPLTFSRALFDDLRHAARRTRAHEPPPINQVQPPSGPGAAPAG
jgi:hypothetical protein